MKIKKNKNPDLRQGNLEDTLEFISLDDVGIEKYSRTSPAFVKNFEEEEDKDYEYEEEDYDDVDDEEDYEDIDDDIYYEDEEDYEDEEIEEDYEYYEDGAGGFRKNTAFFMNMSTVDYVVALTGVIILVLAGVAGVMFVANKMNAEQLETFAEVGVGVENIPVIGESGLLAIAEVQAAKLVAAELQQTEEEADQVDDETGKIAAELNLTSIQKDLKIKFINKKTGKLIPNITFEVEVTDPSGKTSIWKDDDNDGIIYKTGITPGRYQVAINKGDQMAEYSFPAEPIAITVRDTIEYKKVDVAAEVKTEAQVNAAVEDTKVNETVVESVNADTVEWVESTKTLIEGTEETQEIYEEVSKDRITDPSTKTAAGFRLMAGVMETGSYVPMPLSEVQPDATTDPTEEPSEEPADEPTAEPTEEPSAGETEATPSSNPTQAPTEEPKASPAATPTVIPTTAPEARPSVSPSSVPTASPTAAPNNAKNDTATNLKDNDGNQMYVKDGDNYREAKYADYFNSNLKFYKKSIKTTGKYRYTGWQTIDGSVYFFDKNGNYVTGDQVIQGAKYSFGSDGKLSSGSGTMGIDVSKHNGNIDWNAVKNSGVSFAIIRCGYRGSATGVLVEDPMFRNNIKGAKAAGLKVGVYFFCQAVNEVEAVEEASMAVSLVSGYGLDMPIFLDVESAKGGRGDQISKEARTAVCKAFCQTVQNSGYSAGIYANKTWLNEKINTSSLTSYKIWLAQYASAPTYTTTRYDMWQYSSTGRISGISTDVDLNIRYY